MAKVWLEMEGVGRRDLIEKTPTRGTFAGACPACDASPFEVAGIGSRIHDRYTYAAEGFCLACKELVGTMYARMATLFGIDEDELVLTHGRARVY